MIWARCVIWIWMAWRYHWTFPVSSLVKSPFRIWFSILRSLFTFTLGICLAFSISTFTFCALSFAFFLNVDFWFLFWKCALDFWIAGSLFWVVFLSGYWPPVCAKKCQEVFPENMLLPHQDCHTATLNLYYCHAAPFCYCRADSLATATNEQFMINDSCLLVCCSHFNI